MIFNIYLLILQQLTKLIYSMIKNLLPIKWLAVNILGLSLSLLGINGFAQNKKLDPRFDGIFNSKASKGKNTYFQQPSAQPLKLDEHLVVTPEGKKKMYSAIIYTKNADLLRKKGILIQAEFPQFVTALVDAESLKTLVNEPSVSSIKSVDYASPSNDISRAQSGASLLQDGALNNTKYTGKNVLVGVLDTGIDWKHPDFRDIDDNTKSRIYSIWDMSLTPTGDEKSPEGFNYGVEYTRQMIEDELDGTPADFVREKDDEGHGTHVAGTAAGNGAGLPSRKHKGFAPDAELVIVKGEVNGGFSSANVINALKYFELIAKKLGKPIVVNMSLGGHSSSHDGTSSQEIALNEFVKEKSRAVIVAAGNEYGDNLHTSVTLAPNESKPMIFKLSNKKEDESDNKELLSYLLIFGTENNPVDAKITTPDGKTYDFPEVDDTPNYNISDGAFSLLGDNAIYSSNLKRFFQFLLYRNKGHKKSPSGDYTITFTNKGNKNITLHGYKYDINEKISTEWKNPDNQYIVGSPGSADGAITVAAYAPRVSFVINEDFGGSDTEQEGIAPFSSEGPRTDGTLKPDITAAGMFIISSKTNGTEGNYYKSSQGTSMATPAVSGAVALLFQQDPNLTASKIKELLTTTANKDEKTTNQPNPRWGYGKLNIYSAFAKLLGDCYPSEYERIFYDNNGTFSEDASWGVKNRKAIAVKFTPTKTGKLGGATIYLTSKDDTNNDLKIEVRKTKSDGSVGEILASKNINANNWTDLSWNYIDLSDLNVQVTTGEDFFINFSKLNSSISLRVSTGNADGRTFISNDGEKYNKVTNFDAKIRAYVYEDQPQVKHLAETNHNSETEITKGKNYLISNCDLIARVEKDDNHNISGNISAKVWVDNTLPKYVSRRYQIVPNNNADNASGKVTLYFTQAEFDAYNKGKAVQLPTSATDEANKANVIIEKYLGSSNDNSGTPSSYNSSVQKIIPSVENIRWNDTYKYWEVTFENTGFGGFLIGTEATLAVEKTQNNDLRIYPNPVKDIINITLVNNGKIEIFNTEGRLLKSFDGYKGNNPYNVSDLPKGVYLLNIKFDNGKKISEKIIKE